MKLTAKLTLTFLLVSLAAIGLAAVFVGITTSIGFNQYLVDQRLEQFVSVASEYYRSHGNWPGVDNVLRTNGLLPPLVAPGSPPPDPQPYALVDQNRQVIVPGGPFQVGDKIQKGTLTKGIDININGLVVGTVLQTGAAPVRSTIENKYINSVNQSLLVAGLGGALIALLLGLFMARTLTQPLRALTAATHSMAQGQLSQPVPVQSNDEIGELAQSFNQMVTDLAESNQARRQMTADIAHDLRNPLTVLGGYLESLQDGKLSPTPARLAVMQAEVQLLQHLVEDLRTLSLADSGELTLQRQPVSPLDLLTRVSDTYQQQAEEKGIHLLIEAPQDLGEFSLDLARMEQVLGNLVSNALRYTPQNGQICLQAARKTPGLELSVHDTGSGITPDILPHIFERSYRGDSSRSGNESGLGLAIVRSLTELHGGSIRVESQLGQGSHFMIILPG
jgi:signal transduction histidine kinase